MGCGVLDITRRREIGILQRTVTELGRNREVEISRVLGTISIISGAPKDMSPRTNRVRMSSLNSFPCDVYIHAVHALYTKACLPLCLPAP